MTRSIIYALAGPDGEERYIGRTMQRLTTRTNQHIRDARAGKHRYVCYWIRKVGFDISARVLEVTNDPYEAEKRWIAQFRANGARLVNLTDGGGGTEGMKLSEEAKAKISAHRKGKPLSAEHRAKLAAAHRGVRMSDAHRAAISQGMKGRTYTPERRANISKSHLGQLNPMSRTNRARRAEGIAP